MIGPASGAGLRHWVYTKPAATGALLLTFLYVYNYLAYYALPGNQVAFPLGWWGWWDQSQFLKSTLALARFDLSPDQHWYPLGYALLGAPFAGLLRLRMHPFFFVDLTSLLVAYAACNSFMRQCGLPIRWAVMLFLLSVAGDQVLFMQWVIPWNTTPVAAMLWLLLATASRHMAGIRRPMMLGFLAISVPILRPTEALLVIPSLLAVLAADLRHGRIRWADIVRFAVGVLAPSLLFGALYLGTYGFHLNDYMRRAGEIGFTLYDLSWKAYVILVDPRAWIGGGEGLIARCPWLVFGIAGLAPAMRRPGTAVLAVTLILHSVLYLSFVDLLPTNFWRFLSVHYWTWSFPGFALLGVLLVRDLWSATTRLPAAAALAAVALMLCVKIVPVPTSLGSSVKAVDFLVGQRSFDKFYFDPLQMVDAAGPMENIKQVRAIAIRQGVRILALTRSLEMPFTVSSGDLSPVNAVPLSEQISFGLPSWLWGRSDEMFGPRL